MLKNVAAELALDEFIPGLIPVDVFQGFQLDIARLELRSHDHACRVGQHAYIGGYSVVTQDALPFVKTVGHRPAVYGINKIGLQRKGMEPEAIKRLEVAYRVLVKSGLSTSNALEKLEAEHAGFPEVEALIEFVATSQRGVIKTLPGSRKSRGGGGG